MSDLPLHRTMQDDEIDRLKAQLKEAEEKGRVLMDMCRDFKARVRELESTGSTSTSCPFCFDQMRNSYILRKQAEAMEDFLEWANDYCSGWAQDDAGRTYWHDAQIKGFAQRLRNQADELENPK